MNVPQKSPEQIAWQLHNIEVEQALLGAILLHNSALPLAARHVESEHFFEPLHREIFQVCSTLIEAGKKADPLIVKTFLPNVQVGPNMPLQRYLAQMALDSVGILAAEDYARTVRELADRRKLTEVAAGLMPADASPAAGLAAEAIDVLDTILTSNASGTLPALSMPQVMARTVDKIAQAYASESKITGIPTGLRDLDAKIAGLQRTDLVLLAGRPGMGKSAFLLNLLRQAAKRDNHCLCFSKEMSADQLGERMISDALFDLRNAKVPYNALRTGNFHERMFDYVRDVADDIAKLPVTIEEQSGLTMSQIATRARRYKRKHGRLDILAVDHLGLIKAADRYRGHRVMEITEITGQAKALAKELGCVFLLLSQLSRKVEEREDKRPQLSDLRDSGSIEQDADAVIFLYRPAYYLSNAEPHPGTEEYLTWMTEMEKATNLLYAIVAKQRMGPTGSIELFCDIGNNAVRDIGIGEHLP